MKLICLTILSSLFLLGSCGSDKHRLEAGNDNAQRISKSPVNTAPSTVEITHSNRTAKVKVNLDVHSQDVYIKMTGHGESKTSGSAQDNLPSNSVSKIEGFDTPSPAKSKQGQTQPTQMNDPWEEVKDLSSAPSDSNLTGKLNQVIAEIRKAQEFFYQKKYPEALEMAQSSLNKKETAEGFALLGSIYYVMENQENAIAAWKQSLKLNPDMPKVTQMLNKLQEN